MKTKLFKVLLGAITLVVLMFVVFLGIKLTNDIPTFKEGPVPMLGNEVGSIRPETKDQINMVINWKKNYE